jgi:hypothetical protein
MRALDAETGRPPADESGSGLGGLHGWLERRLTMRGWAHAAALAALLLATAFSFPVPQQAGPDNARILDERWGRVVDEKVADPLRDMARHHPPKTNEAKRTFRITAPAVGYATGTGRTGARGFALACGYALLLAAARLGQQLTGSRAGAASLTVMAAATYFGSAALVDYYWWFDSVAFAFLLAAMQVSRPGGRAAALVAAFFCDERALLVSPATALVGAPGASRRGAWAATGFAIGLYAALRAALTAVLDLETAVAGIGLDEAAKHASVAGWALWSGLEGGWLLVAVGLVRLGRTSEARAATTFWALYAATFVASCFLVHDVTRSLSFGVVFVFPLIAALRRRMPVASLHDLLLAAALASLVVPNVFVANRIDYQVDVVSCWLGR